MPYFAGTAPKDVNPWVEAEFRKLAEILNRGSDRLSIAPRNVAPSKPRTGDVVYADGTNWNPGKGEGVYVYNGSEWVRAGGGDELLGYFLS